MNFPREELERIVAENDRALLLSYETGLENAGDIQRAGFKVTVAFDGNAINAEGLEIAARIGHDTIDRFVDISQSYTLEGSYDLVLVNTIVRAIGAEAFGTSGRFDNRHMRNQPSPPKELARCNADRDASDARYVAVLRQVFGPNHETPFYLITRVGGQNSVNLSSRPFPDPKGSTGLFRVDFSQLTELDYHQGERLVAGLFYVDPLETTRLLSVLPSPQQA